jgi:hypothetical protein
MEIAGFFPVGGRTGIGREGELGRGFRAVEIAPLPGEGEGKIVWRLGLPAEAVDQEPREKVAAPRISPPYISQATDNPL